MQDLGRLLSDTELDAYMDASMREMMSNSEEFTSCPTCEAPISRVILKAGDPALQAAAPHMEVTATGQPLEGASLEHFNNHRYRCPSCSTVFCAACQVAGYHNGFSCAEYKATEHMRQCRFCDNTLKATPFLPNPADADKAALEGKNAAEAVDMATADAALDTARQAPPAFVADFTSFAFDGFSEYGDAGNLSSVDVEALPRTGLTVEAWVRPSKQQLRNRANVDHNGDGNNDKAVVLAQGGDLQKGQVGYSLSIAKGKLRFDMLGEKEAPPPDPQKEAEDAAAEAAVAAALAAAPWACSECEEENAGSVDSCELCCAEKPVVAKATSGVDMEPMDGAVPGGLSMLVNFTTSNTAIKKGDAWVRDSGAAFIDGSQKEKLRLPGAVHYQGSSHNSSGLSTAALVEAGGVGVAVERGPDWYENDQDGGEGNTGVVVGFLDGDGKEHGEYGHIGLLKKDCANVKWDGRGDSAYHYSMGCDEAHEFELSLSKAKCEVEESPFEVQYGWTTSHTSHIRDRSSDYRHGLAVGRARQNVMCNGICHMFPKLPGNAVRSEWHAKLPPGVYKVSLTVGDDR